MVQAAKKLLQKFISDNSMLNKSSLLHEQNNLKHLKWKENWCQFSLQATWVAFSFATWVAENSLQRTSHDFYNISREPSLQQKERRLRFRNTAIFVCAILPVDPRQFSCTSLLVQFHHQSWAFTIKY